mmetsp:Transcript_29064/g.62288  ORF Transcript_29064/g.62288 Transcript_29064/m.62288 type:complete len:530 (-) Transcript_29064:1659-3248(-)|eukprot:CAMPEP_0201122448 /NCGR_PEP_ID=MMETSP0850-20130426/6101_1 /ASSEMBLY_ACC=CAM_ASM_000622 /TAXON_ID=183588 /ORGANISM="Pseudo-nitzschia fraudulenta, Strain WWA7" /LENGTH=529 /DNA_ID=CAMNT_0047389151 /DNA_START=76 /DNA_END=1665 /DNA_ORIENTATION=-
MIAASPVARNSVFTILLLLTILCIVRQNVHDKRKGFLFCDAKEIEPTKEWQLLEANDTIPAGMHVRMDLTTGEKWVKIMEDENQGDESNGNVKNIHVNTNEIGKSSASVAVVESDGDVNIDQNDNDDSSKPSKGFSNYNFEMMHRTLSKLPPEEIEAMGGLPDIPNPDYRPERKAFEEHMLEIWKKRQAELLELELNFPEILKARIKGIEEYLTDPETQLEQVDLDADLDHDVVTDIVSLLKDLEFQLSDIDMARDFHTMNGWPLLVRLLSEEIHVPVNKTIDELSRSTKTKIRTIQSHAAWAIGTAVKNTEEFYPFGVESVAIFNGKTTAIDRLIDIFCKQYDDSNSWEIRTLLAKGIYAIGAILRGNHPAQTYVAKTGGFDRIGQKYREISQQGFNSANTKLIQRMAGLSMDIFEDLSLHIELSETETDADIIQSISSAFCDATCELHLSETFVPVMVQETLVKAIAVLGPRCQESTCEVSSFRSIIESIQSGWLKNKDRFDADHFQELLDSCRRALESLDGTSQAE